MPGRRYELPRSGLELTSARQQRITRVIAGDILPLARCYRSSNRLGGQSITAAVAKNGGSAEYILVAHFNAEPHAT